MNCTAQRCERTEITSYRIIFSETLAQGLWRPTTEALRECRAEVEAMHGRSHALATLDGVAVGTGFISSCDGVAEVTRVATVPAARRRGVATTVTSFMVRDRFALGDTLCWLTASGDPAQALYHSLGFVSAGHRAYYHPKVTSS